MATDSSIKIPGSSDRLETVLKADHTHREGMFLGDPQTDVARLKVAILTALTSADYGIGVFNPALADAFDPTSNRLRVHSMPPELSVNMFGLLNAKTAHHYSILGSRSLGWSSTLILGDACDYLDTTQALMNTPTTAQTLYIRSTSNNDKAGGPGATEVRTVYIDANGDQQTRNDILTGTTQFSIGSGYAAIQWMEVKGLAGAEVSAGDITISSTNGAATVATTFEKITAGGNRSLSGRYKIPKGYSAYILDISMNSVGAANQDIRFRGDWFADDLVLSAGVYHFKERTFLNSNTGSNEPMHFLKAPEFATLKVSSIPSAVAPGNSKLDVGFDILVVQN